MMKRDTTKTRPHVVAFVKKSFADGAAAIQAKGDKGLADLVVDPLPTSSIAWKIWPTATSSTPANTTASSSVYYRLSGLVPPESRPKK